MSAQDNIDSQNVKPEKNNFFDSDDFKIFHAVSKRNYQLNPFYIELTGSVTSGYFLTQLVFLATAYNYSEFYKTDEYFVEKLKMTEWEVRNHKKILMDLGFVSIVKAGFPARSHYKVNMKKIIEMAKKDVKLPESGSHEETSSLKKPSSKQSEKDGNRTEDSSDKSRGNLVTGLYKDPLLDNNNKEGRYNQEQSSLPQPLVVVSEDLKSMLESINLKEPEFWVKTYGEKKIREKFAMMPPESRIESSPAAWMRAALERDFPPPKNVTTLKNGGYDLDPDALRDQRFKDSDEEYKKRMQEYKESEPDNVKRFIDDVLCVTSNQLAGALS